MRIARYETSAVSKTLGETITKDGFFDINQPGRPASDKSVGLAPATAIEYQWTDGATFLSPRSTEPMKVRCMAARFAQLSLRQSAGDPQSRI